MSVSHKDVCYKVTPIPNDSLVGCHLWGHTESDMTEVTNGHEFEQTLGDGEGQGSLV